eukprot:Gb_02678 [translate_table: standard]
MTTSLLSADNFRLHLLLMILIPLFCFCDSDDSPYDICSQATCGSLIKISYPFGLSNSGCGHPDFQIECVSNDPLLTINGLKYRILERPLDNQTDIKIANDRVFANCGLPEASVNLSGSPFHLANAFEYNLTLVLGCKATLIPQVLLPLVCNTTWRFILYEMFPWSSWNCSSVVGVPIQTGETANALNLFSLLRKGFQIEWDTNDVITENCKNCTLSSKGICGYNVSDHRNPFLCHYPEHTNGGGIRKAMIGIIIGACTGAAALIAAATLFFRVYLRKQVPETRILEVNQVETFLEEYNDQMPTRYSYSQLKRITNNFAHKLGKGGFGVVYKGNLSNGSQVAVKLLDESKQSEKQFMNEVGTIGRTHHVNLVRLLGFCAEGLRRALLYEFMVNGSLEKFIFDSKDRIQTLDYKCLHDIALGASRGIAYLHQDCDNRIIHFDIKPHNILLDANFTPKVSDFGLAKLCSRGRDHITMTAARGTPGYVAPEVWSRNFGPVSDKADVYGFGMLLLEMVGGRKNIDLNASSSTRFCFPEWAFRQLERGELWKSMELAEDDREIARQMTIVGLWCIQTDSSNRPPMSKVVKMLEGNIELTIPPSPTNNSSQAPLLLTSSQNSSSQEN